jgi:glycosyltransferase involved in cell wall biosynthesis
LVGDGPRRSQLEELTKEQEVSEQVAFLGIRSDIPELLERSDVMVLSSHWEGLSLSSVEGMASGRPFIASDVDGLREVVEGYGLMFPEGDALALAKCICELYEHPELYCSVALRCQKRALDFDISLMAQDYHKCYAKTH